MPLTSVTDFTVQAQHLLRDEHQFKWYVVTLLTLVIGWLSSARRPLVRQESFG